jgi:heme-degrading monooxygenase HmoA
MIVRIVKMEFKEHCIDKFIALFESKKEMIRNYAGCRHLELLQGDGPQKTVFYTYSYWDSEEALNNYRYSDLFASTWDATKILFSKKAEAITLNKLYSLD